MDSVAASRLAGQLAAQSDNICSHVASRLLRAFPELTQSLRLEENYQPMARLRSVAVDRLNELVRSVLLFEQLSLADSEFRWAHAVLPRSGVTYEHQSAMVRWYFDEVRRLPLGQSELSVVRELEQHFLGQVRQAYAEQ